MGDEESLRFIVIDVYQPYYDLVWVYISEGKCETHYAADRKMEYNLPSYLQGKKPDLSHLVSGETPYQVFLNLQGHLDALKIQYIPFNVSLGREVQEDIYRIAIHLENKVALERIISDMH